MTSQFRSPDRTGHAAGVPYIAFAPERLRAALRGKNLACWCPLDGPCHADALLRIANA